VHALLELGDRDTHLDEIARAVFCVAAPVIVIVVSRPDETSQVSKGPGERKRPNSEALIEFNVFAPTRGAVVS
jgi:hypothetical protein